jgi:regulatory protein
MFRTQRVSKEQALQKLKHFCGYQERSHQEAKEKLYSFGLRKRDVEEAMSQLIEEGYLNEERFAIEFAGGKFRIKQWGRVKIAYALKQKRVSAYCIAKAMDQIDEEHYQRVLEKLAQRKWNTLTKETSPLVRVQKTKAYLLQRGFEAGHVGRVLEKELKAST